MAQAYDLDSYRESRTARGGNPSIQGVRGLKLRYEALRTELARSGYRSRWRELNDYLLPHKSRFREDQRYNDAKPRSDLVLDSTATQALRTLRSGMMSGITSPARPWFRLSAPDPDLNDFGPVREWLYYVQRNMEWLFSNTNLYKILPSVYETLPAFGPCVVAMLEDTERVLRFEEFPIGSYTLALSDTGRIDTCYRDVHLTVRQVVEKFGIDVCSSYVKQAWMSGQLYQNVDVVHVIEPRPEDERYPGSALGKYKRWKSCWYEFASSDDRYLRESGYDVFPLLTPRWEASIESPYGHALGVDVLPDVKQLQSQSYQKLRGLDKMIDPPTQGPPVDSIDILPAGHTAVPLGSTEGIRSLYEVRLPLGELRQDMEETRARVRKGLFEDLFLMLSQIDRSQITAYEIAERKEEKLLQLGPVLESINDDLLDPLIKNTFGVMQKRGMIPPPPRELAQGGGKLRIEYISILHQAQRAVGVSAVDRLITMALGMAQLWPGVVDKIDTDEVIDDVAERLGTPPKLVRGQDEVEAARGAREKAQMAMQAAAAAPQLAGAAKDLATAPLKSPDGGETALSAAAKAVGLT